MNRKRLLKSRCALAICGLPITAQAMVACRSFCCTVATNIMGLAPGDTTPQSGVRCCRP